MPNTPYKIIVHHTADGSTGQQLAKVNNYHRERGFSKSSLGYFVGYHYLLERDGKVVQTRDEAEYGMHDAGENVNTLGVALAGNFNLNTPTREQVSALGELLVTLCTRYGLSALDIEPHRIHDTTDCYGRLLSDSWASYIYVGAEYRLGRKALSWLIVSIKNILSGKK